MGIPGVVLLLTAGAMEICFVTSLKLTNGFSTPVAIVATMAFGGASFFLLGLALKSLPVGVAYAVWTGIGMAGAALIGALVFDDKTTWQAVVGILLILAGAVLLSLMRGPQG